MKVLCADAGATCGLAVLHAYRGKSALVDWASTRDPLSHPLWLAHLDSCDLFVVEVSERIYPKGDSGLGAKLATNVGQSMKQGGVLMGVAMARGVVTMEVNAIEVRRNLFGKGNASDKEVANGLRLILAGIGPRSDEHERDAAAAGIYGAQRHRLGLMVKPLRAAGGTR